LLLLLNLRSRSELPGLDILLQQLQQLFKLLQQDLLLLQPLGGSGP
jgi:hypothetical protein